MGHNPWRKIWHDRLRSSPKWTRLRTVERGFWFDCFLIAKDDGRLELLPDTPLTPQDLSYEFRNRREIIEKWILKLTNVGLMEKRDGFIWLVGMSDLCQMSAKRLPTDCQMSAKPLRKPGVSAENAQMETSSDNGLRVRSSAGGAKSLSTEAEEEKKQKKEPPKSPKGGPTYTDEFLAFWAAYPKKVGKGAAWAKWGSRNGTPLPIILSALEKQAKSDQWQKDAGQFIPNPATWLHQRRWEDEEATIVRKQAPSIEGKFYR